LPAARYEDLVFINCPFDSKYSQMLRAIIFVVYRCGFTPVSALSFENGLENRLSKIQHCIQSAKYGIHDISNTALNKEKLPRFNMPFEPGLFFGAKHFGTGNQKKKNALIFDVEPYRYQKYISDLSGVDIKGHQNKAENVIKHIRDWLKTSSKRKNLPGEVMLNKEYENFKKTIPLSAKRLGFRQRDIPYNDYCSITEEGIQYILSSKMK
jgi:hypothetical protein